MRSAELLALERVYALDEAALAPLLAAAELEGSGIVRTLVEEWRSGANRFDRGAAEALWRVRQSLRWIAIGGLSIDPWAQDARTGRVRRFFVLPAFRGSGCGSRLLSELLAHARLHFDRLVLHTDRAGPFYEGHGFVRFADERTQSTHTLELRARR